MRKRKATVGTATQRKEIHGPGIVPFLTVHEKEKDAICDK